MLTKCLIFIIGLLHFYIMILEMFLWNTPRTMKIFNTTTEFANQSKTLASNLGLYNGFLASGIFVGLFSTDVTYGFGLLKFSLTCILVAGLYGGYTANKRIYYIQALPAVIALVLLLK